MTEASGRVLPELDQPQRLLLEVGRGRHAPLPALLRLWRAAPSAERGVPVLPFARVGAGRGVGRAVVAGFTLNEQMWIPSFPPPYLIAIVAIEEDDRIRLTTNLVNVPADDVFVGMKVQVVFEHTEDVWVPLFEPTGESEKGPFPAEDPKIYDARPMPKAGDKFEDKVAVTGIGLSRIGRRLMTDPIVLAVEAAESCDRRRRADARRHRRPHHLPRRHVGRRHVGRRDLRARGRAARSGRRGSTAGSRRRARAAR